MAFDPKDVRNIAVALTLGGLAGAAVIQGDDEQRGNQAEREDPSALNAF